MGKQSNSSDIPLKSTQEMGHEQRLRPLSTRTSPDEAHDKQRRKHTSCSAGVYCQSFPKRQFKGTQYEVPFKAVYPKCKRIIQAENQSLLLSTC